MQLLPVNLFNDSHSGIMEKVEEHIMLVLSKLKLIFPLVFFDIMVHLVMHLPEEAILGGLVQMRCMYLLKDSLKHLRNMSEIVQGQKILLLKGM